MSKLHICRFASHRLLEYQIHVYLSSCIIRLHLFFFFFFASRTSTGPASMIRIPLWHRWKLLVFDKIWFQTHAIYILISRKVIHIRYIRSFYCVSTSTAKNKNTSQFDTLIWYPPPTLMEHFVFRNKMIHEWRGWAPDLKPVVTFKALHHFLGQNNESVFFLIKVKCCHYQSV
jgi:hypothetical protein